MRKNKLLSIVVFFFQSILPKESFCQSFILRPSFGSVFFNTKTDLSLPHQLDSTFNGKYSSSRIAATIAVELKYEKESYELTFTSQQDLTASFTHFKKVRMAEGHFTNGGISQFQFVYNRFITNQKKAIETISPILGIGFGLGINRPKSFYDSSYYNSIFYSTDFPNEYIGFNQTEKSLSNLSYSLVLKLGGILKYHGIERLRLMAIYNRGLNKYIRSDIHYSHTSKNYFGSTTSRGSQFSILLSVPIYLKREKEKSVKQ